VVLGAAIAGGVSLWQVQLITAREREARQALREQERRDTHDAFQRDAILALHDAITDYWQTALAAQVQIHGPIHGPTEAGQETLDHQSIFSPVRADYWRMSAARTKVFDDELRGMVNDFSLQIDVVLSMDIEQAPRSLVGELWPPGADRGPHQCTPQRAVLTCSWAEHQLGDGRGSLRSDATGIAGNANASSPPTDRTGRLDCEGAPSRSAGPGLLPGSWVMG
jgi:hypothetical protein